MSSRSELLSAPADPPPGARQLAHGITATWWYTAGVVIFFEVFLVLLWALRVVAAPTDVTALLVLGLGGLVWCVSTLSLLRDYRHRVDAGPGIAWTRIVVPLLVALAFGIAAGLITSSWLLAVMPIAQSMVLLNWPQGVRYRVLLLLTLFLVCLALVDTAQDASRGVEWWLPTIYTILTPMMTVSSLWWWDVLVALDRARASEARLAATQERLRVASDVHDLQGHHLQVIALQLELAERLMPRDPDAALEQLKAARTSVDEARQGTRDLATRFRSVPLGDELANAKDLLEAAGLTVDTEIAPDADRAPASDLGPVIRETTTNVLRHGRGTRARLALVRTPDAWRYEISNEADPTVTASRDGSGLEGIRRRIGEAGGSLDVLQDDADFTVVATVPTRDGGVR